MPLRYVLVVTLAFALPFGTARAEPLPLPENLTAFSSEAGEKLLLEADAREAFFPLAAAFVTQQNQAYCGVASIVMVLNALKVPAPAVPEYEPYRIFTQSNVLGADTDAILPREVLARIGMTLDQAGAILSSRGTDAQVHHAGDSSLDEFRRTAAGYLGEPGRFVIVNYLRRTLGQQLGGHISPLAAYDAETDRFLILDVARYKYPPAWVKAADLFDAMNTADSDNAGRTRGYVLIAAGPVH